MLYIPAVYCLVCSGTLGAMGPQRKRGDLLLERVPLGPALSSGPGIISHYVDVQHFVYPFTS